MKSDVSNEQHFLAEVDAFQFIARDMEHIIDSLENWLARLRSELQAHPLTFAGLDANSALAYEAQAVNHLLQDSAQAWQRQWSDLEPAQALAGSFDDKALLLVFGKFNAGKSSFCNFLAERFAAHGKTVEYFHVDAGRIVETSEPFAEGVTETTARLQGVRLGSKLVLLDTPGLHSVSPENAALTQRFTESADGVLWLTSSTAPGQVQELDELGRELHRNKPLLPVITRSDVFDEDEVDGEIRKVLRNKSEQNRAQQQADVKARALEKLTAMNVPAALLKPPVSVSTYTARDRGQSRAALSEAGFEALYAALLGILEPTLAYKRRKLAETLLHHLEERVLGTLCCEVLPLLAELDVSLQSAPDALEQQQRHIENGVWRTVAPTLPALLDTHAANGNMKAIRETLGASVLEAFSRETASRLSDYTVEADPLLARIDFDDPVEIDYQGLYSALGEAIRESVLRLSAHVGKQCRASIRDLNARSQQLQRAVRVYEQELLDLKGRVRASSA
ncbi:GTP-binding protein, HSR1-related [Caballeronia hypogeia]|uniref:GTP-binding protein, HSR1-related n=1 Tax=Caballeronia hypogeia TaxID=1777140 RepID=A0A158D470_9BURK|nr:dynamin family protein [Caballeronia hypogeia]SAK89301.1 GTP-binding protein, HSR1-related [Caballeronia hypogeia]